MGRLRLDLPTALGEDLPGTPRLRGTQQGDDITDATQTFVDWVDCWAGR